MEVDVLADQGAEDNLIVENHLESIQLKTSNVQITPLHPAQNFRAISGHLCLTCKDEAK